MPNWNHYDDQELSDTMDHESKPIFSKRFMEECLDAASEARNIKDEDIKITVLKNRAKDSLNESLEAYKEYRSNLYCCQEMNQKEISIEIKGALIALADEHQDFPTQEKMKAQLLKIQKLNR